MTSSIDPGPLREAAEQEIIEGLAGCQLAVGQGGKIAWTQSFGVASPETRFPVASATKPIVASALWVLIGEGRIDIRCPVADYVPEFRGGGKEAVTVEQVLLMTCGFPSARMHPAEGADAARRVARLATWELEYEPGTRYVYHGSSAHWVMAELIERVSGMGFCDFIEERVTRPLGLPRLLGIPREEQTDMAPLSLPPERDAGFDPVAAIEAGIPGGGGAMTAATLALFYQALLHNPEGLWKSDVLEDAISHVRCTLPDPLLQMPANRTLGVVVGNGFGATWGRSPTAFGWPGAGGQTGFAEPETGISFAFLQTGDHDEMRHFGRAVRFSNLALDLGR